MSSPIIQVLRNQVGARTLQSGGRTYVGAPLVDWKWSPEIMQEEKDTDMFIRTLGKAIYDTLIVPFAVQRDTAYLAFEKQNGRPPISEADAAIVRSLMPGQPTPGDDVAHSFHGAWVKSWQDFFDRWDHFWNTHQGESFKSYATYSDTVDFKKKANEYREQFLAFNTVHPADLPPPSIPEVARPSNILPSIDSGLIKAGIMVALGVILVPPIFNAFRKGG